MIKISIIIPVYNGEKYLETCVRSLLGQTLDAVEYIFVDDCTRDNSITLIERLAESYPERKPFLKIIHHDRNSGIATARNTGIDHAEGEYLFFIDQDDYLDLNALEIFYREAKAGNADIVYTDYLWQYKRFHLIQKNGEASGKEELIIKMLSGQLPWILWSRLYRKDFINKHHLRIPIHTSGADDLAIVPVLFYYAERVKYLNWAPYHYVRYNDQALTRRRVHPDWINHTTNALNYLESFFSDKGSVYSGAVERAKALHKLIWLRDARGPLQKQITGLFPEVNMKVYLDDFKKEDQRIYYLSMKNRYFLQNSIINCIDFSYWLKRMIRNTGKICKNN
jgi:glycosyltransferase involved in cell wall biosynthesis